MGRIDPRKAIDTAISALALLPSDARLAVIGRGDTECLRQLRMLAEELDVADRVEFDEASRSALPRVYADADVLLFTSRWAEPFGLVPVEAMACATPVVATGTGGSAEFLVDEVNCLLYPAGDAAALAARITRLAEDPGLRERLVMHGTSTAAELTVGRLADVLEAWHLAAAVDFRDGQPSDRPAPTPAAS